jgi:hypothetical protein
MICIGESDYFRYNNPEEENCQSDNDEHTFASSFINKDSTNDNINNNNLNSNKKFVSKVISKSSNQIYILFFLNHT